tara:strand:- start:92 stop:937 length:846 start_codon:yes stop_codon:yes gene_type:complete
MKKLLGILVLGLLWCNTVFALSNVEKQAIKKYFRDNNLETIEGLWLDNDDILEAYVKSGDKIKIYRVSGGKQSKSKLTGEISGSKDIYKGYAVNSNNKKCDLIINLIDSNTATFKCKFASFFIKNWNYKIKKVWPTTEKVEISNITEDIFTEINVPNKYLGNCGITKGGLSKDLLDMYLKSAFKFAKKYNFNTNIKSDELFYCNLSDKIGITFTTIPYNSNNIGNGQYVSIGRAGNSSCIMYMIVDTSISNTKDQMLMVDYNVQSNKFGLSTSNFRNKDCY